MRDQAEEWSAEGEAHVQPMPKAKAKCIALEEGLGLLAVAKTHRPKMADALAEAVRHFRKMEAALAEADGILEPMSQACKREQEDTS